MMLALLLYSYCSAEYSSRRIARATYEDVATRFLTGDQHPHFTRIAAFRREHLDALSSLFVATVQLCARAGLVELGHVSVDATKIQANASKQRMADKLRSPEGDARYRRRKATVEPVFGKLEEARGFRRFLLRGLHKVSAEWAQLSATHNRLLLFRRAWTLA